MEVCADNAKGYGTYEQPKIVNNKIQGTWKEI